MTLSRDSIARPATPAKGEAVTDKRVVGQFESSSAAISHAQAMHELAALSFDPRSLDRDLEDEINRNAWGISEP